MYDTWEQIFWAKRNETQRRVCSKNADMIFEEFGNQLDVLSRLSSEPFLQTLKKGPFLCSNNFDAKHESEHSVNSSFKASSSSSRWLLLLSWAMNYHSHRQLSTGILLAMGGLLCEVWARKPTFEEGELAVGERDQYPHVSASSLFYSYERCSLLQTTSGGPESL